MTLKIKPGVRRPRADDRRIFEIQSSLFLAHAFLLGLEMDLYPTLADGPLTPADIAKKLKMDEAAAETLLIACTSLEVLERQGNRFALTPMAKEYLLPDSPTYYGDYLRPVMLGNPAAIGYEFIKELFMNTAEHSLDMAATFNDIESNSRRRRVMTRVFQSYSSAASMEWPHHFDLEGTRHMVDVGGGAGHHSVGAVKCWPNLKATVFEMPATAELTREFIADHGVENRVSVETGDFWNDPLPRGDLYFFGNVFHDWTDAQCRMLADKSFSAIDPGGRILVHEWFYNDERSGPSTVAGLDIIALAHRQARKRSVAEMSTILEASGFQDISATPTFGYWTVVCGHKPT